MKVVISPEFGGAFSTWTDPRMAVDTDIIALVEKGFDYEEMENLCKQKGYIDEDYGFVSGVSSLKIEEVPEGAMFKIREYDGAEYIEIFNPDEWYKATE